MSHSRNRPGTLVSTMSAALFAFTAPATAGYDETVLGDLSNDPLNPTPVAFTLGDNIITGSMGSSNDVVNGDRDFLTFTIGAGQQLGGLFLLSLTPADRGFHAISAGPTSVIPSGPGAGDVSTYLGSNHLDPVSASVNLLTSLGTPLAGSGFTPPLGPGTYSYMVQQTGAITQGYSLNFVVTPEPASLTLLTLGTLGLTRRYRRNESH